MLWYEYEGLAYCSVCRGQDKDADITDPRHACIKPSRKCWAQDQHYYTVRSIQNDPAESCLAYCSRFGTPSWADHMLFRFTVSRLPYRIDKHLLLAVMLWSPGVTVSLIELSAPSLASPTPLHRGHRYTMSMKAYQSNK